MRGPLPEGYNLAANHKQRMHIIVPTIDIIEILSAHQSDSLEKQVQRILDGLEPGCILRLTHHAFMSDALLRILISEIHNELYEIVPIFYMLQYPQDGLGKTYHKRKKSQNTNKSSQNIRMVV